MTEKIQGNLSGYVTLMWINWGCVVMISTERMSFQKIQTPPLYPTASTRTQKLLLSLEHMLPARMPLTQVSINLKITAGLCCLGMSFSVWRKALDDVPLQFQIKILMDDI